MGYVLTNPFRQKGKAYDPTVKKPVLPHAIRSSGDGRTCPKCRVVSPTNTSSCPRCGAVYGR